MKKLKKKGPDTTLENFWQGKKEMHKFEPKKHRNIPTKTIQRKKESPN